MIINTNHHYHNLKTYSDINYCVECIKENPKKLFHIIQYTNVAYPEKDIRIKSYCKKCNAIIFSDKPLKNHLCNRCKEKEEKLKIKQNKKNIKKELDILNNRIYYYYVILKELKNSIIYPSPFKDLIQFLSINYPIIVKYQSIYTFSGNIIYYGKMG